MARKAKVKRRFRITLSEHQEGVSLNVRRPTKGIADIEVSEQSGSVLLSVENLKYLENMQKNLLYYYEGWVVLKSGLRISMGPLSVDAKGFGKSYWEFVPENIRGTGLKADDILGVVVTIEALQAHKYSNNVDILIGSVNKEDADCSKLSPSPSYTKYIPVNVPQGTSPTIGSAVEVMWQAKHVFAAKQEGKAPYHWCKLHAPGQQSNPLFFGYQTNSAGIESVAFGFPGGPEQPPANGEGGKWYPSGTTASQGHWIYEARSAG